MRLVPNILFCATLTVMSVALARGQDLSQSERNMRIQKIVRDVIGKTVTLNFKEKSSRTGTLMKANAGEFVLESDGTEEHYLTSGIHSITIGPGVPEGLLVALASILCAGFGVGVATLSFNVEASGIQKAVAVVCGLIGGWIGYESFFQSVELELP